MARSWALRGLRRILPRSSRDRVPDCAKTFHWPEQSRRVESSHWSSAVISQQERDVQVSITAHLLLYSMVALSAIGPLTLSSGSSSSTVLRSLSSTRRCCLEHRCVRSRIVCHSGFLQSYVKQSTSWPFFGSCGPPQDPASIPWGASGAEYVCESDSQPPQSIVYEPLATRRGVGHASCKRSWHRWTC